MSVVAVEGVVDHGLIRLLTGIQLPDRTKVYVIAPSVQIKKKVRVFSPRLRHPEQAADFVMEVVEETANATL